MNRALRRTCLTALTLLALTTTAHAAVFQVTTTADTLDGVCDAHCSLRDAVVASNQAAGSDIILLPSGLYVLSNTGGGEDLAATGDLDVASGEDLKIIGTGPSVPVVDGFGDFGNDRVFDVQPGASLELNGILVRNGVASGLNSFGGGIRNRGELVLVNSVVLGNTAPNFGFGGGIYSDSVLVLRNSVVAGNTAEGGGGGLTAAGEVTVINTEFSGNESLQDFGGGAYLFSDAVATFSNVDFSGNRAAFGGGGLFVENPIFPGTPVYRNVTFEANFAPVGPDCLGACPTN